MTKSLTINDSGMEPSHGFHSLDLAIGIYRHSVRVLTNWNPLTARLDVFKCTKRLRARLKAFLCTRYAVEGVWMYSLRVSAQLSALRVRLIAFVCTWYAFGTHLHILSARFNAVLNAHLLISTSCTRFCCSSSWAHCWASTGRSLK